MKPGVSINGHRLQSELGSWASVNAHIKCEHHTNRPLHCRARDSLFSSPTEKFISFSHPVSCWNRVFKQNGGKTLLQAAEIIFCLLHQHIEWLRGARIFISENAAIFKLSLRFNSCDTVRVPLFYQLYW